MGTEAHLGLFECTVIRRLSADDGKKGSYDKELTLSEESSLQMRTLENENTPTTLDIWTWVSYTCTT